MAIGRRNLIISVLVLFGLAAGYAGTRWLAGDPLQESASDEINLEDEWARTIRKIGIEPVFPPEEDLTVGDVLAVVVKDNKPDAESGDTKLSAEAPLPRRAVKLAHIDVRDALSKAYAALPVFTAPNTPLPAAGGNAKAPPAPGVARDFKIDINQSDLPRAAFPKLKIQGAASANSGFAASLRGFAGYAVDNTGLEELYLTEVRTYGLPSADAAELLKTYCETDQGKAVCLDKTARKHLERIVGDRINSKYVFNKKGDERYRITIDVVMVNRVYLARAIRNLNQSGSSEGARVSLSVQPNGGQDNKSVTEVPQPSGVVADRIELEAMKKRVAELEKQLSGTTGAAASYGRSRDREALLNEAFDRPVAIGYRSVRLAPDDEDEPQ